MKYPDLHKEVPFPIPALMEVNVKYPPKTFLARNGMKNPGLHRKILWWNLYPMGLGGGVNFEKMFL